MPAHDIAQANRDTLADSGQAKMFARDQSEHRRVTQRERTGSRPKKA
jgi:hypothetical protein